MADEDPNEKEWTDEEGRGDQHRLMPWTAKQYPYRLTTFALGRGERNPRLYWLGLAVFIASGLTGLFIILSRYAAVRAKYGELSEEIAAAIVFLPLAVVGLYGLLTGYIPSNAINYIHRGRRVTLYNAGLIVVYGVLVWLIFALGLE